MKKEHFYAIYDTNKKLYLSHGQSTNYSLLREKVKDTNNDIQVVTISKGLYDFLVSQSNGDTWIDIAEYQPTPVIIPYTNLMYDQEKLKNRTLVWKKIQEEDPDFKDVPNHDAFKFQPWTLISKETHTHFEFYSGRPWCSKENPNTNNIILDEDDKNLDITGIYLTHLNGNNDINRLTTFKSLEYDDTPIELDCCGVSDNATQVKKHLEKCIQVYHGAIYGDSINLERAKAIAERLEAKGFATTNIVFGIGSFSYQYHTRDTFGFAVKATAATVNGEERMLFKDPKTDDGTKRSQRGRVVVARKEDVLTEHPDFDFSILTGDQEQNDLVWKDGLYEAEAHYSNWNVLQTVFLDGELLVDESLATIRERLYK